MEDAKQLDGLAQKVKIGIITYHNSINNGAFLQAYSLSKVLQSRLAGKAVVEVLNFQMECARQFYFDQMRQGKAVERIKKVCRYLKFQVCIRRLPLSKKKLISDDIQAFERMYKDEYDIIIAGSDEIWKTDGFRGFPTAYWMGMDLGDVKRISYAASSRSFLDKLNSEKKIYISRTLESYCYIGVRDCITKSQIEKLTEKAVHSNCDPTFLYEFIKPAESDKKRFRNKIGLNPNKPILGLMLHNSNLTEAFIYYLENKYEIVTLYDGNPKGGKKHLSNLSPFQWIDAIGCSDLLISSFFHGVVFAMKQGIPFIGIESEYQGRGKIEDLLNRTGLNKQLVSYTEYEGRIHKERRIARRISLHLDEFIENYSACSVRQAIKLEQQSFEEFYQHIYKIVEELG